MDGMFGVAVASAMSQCKKVNEINTGELKPNTVYRIKTNAALTFEFPEEVEKDKQNQIMIYLQIEENPVSISWGNETLVAFVGAEIANISVGTYRIIAEYNPNMEKWVIGVVQDGPEGGVS